MRSLKSGWMVVAGFFFACMGMLVKFGAHEFSSAELVFYRSLFGLVAIALPIYWRGLPLANPHWKTHVWRGISGFIALALFFFSLSQLPLATAVTLNYTSPLFLAFISVLVLRERPHWRLAFALLLGFAGVVLLLRPTLHAGQWLPALSGLLSGFFAGVALLNVRRLGQLGEPEWRVVFYFTLTSSLGGGLWALFSRFHPLSWSNLWLLLALGASATIGQLAMTRAYREGETLVVGSLAFSTVVFASLLGLAAWGEMLTPAAWLSMAVIVLSGIIGVRSGLRLPA